MCLEHLSYQGGKHKGMSSTCCHLFLSVHLNSFILQLFVSRSLSFGPSTMARASNSMSNKDYAKVIRANKVSMLKEDFSMSLDDFANKHRSLLLDLLEKTRRVSKTSLSSAMLAEDNSLDHSECRHFASRVVEAFASARTIGKSMTSGKKTGPGMKALVEGLRQQRTPSRSPRSRSPTHAAPSSSATPSLPTASEAPTRLSKADAAKALGMSGYVASPAKTFHGVQVVSSCSSDAEHQEGEDNCSISKCLLPDTAIYWVDSHANALCRKFPGQPMQLARMTPGENGFGIAHFEADAGPAEEKQTDIPNLMFATAPSSDHKKLKRPAAAMKRPAAAPKAAPSPELTASSSEQEAVATEPPSAEAVGELPKQGYTVMYYKASGAYAIRETKLGKRQLFQITSKRKTQAQLLKIINAAKEKLKAGENVAAVRDWARNEASN